MESLFVVNSRANVFLEKHWRSCTSKEFLHEHFLVKLKDSLDMPPVIQTSKASTIIVAVKRYGLHFVSICKTEIAPLLVIEFLHRIAENFHDYFGECSEQTITDNYVTVYELLDEMLDNGYPMATENNFLKELIKPPNAVTKLTNSLTGRTNLSETLPSGSLSVTPWRKSNVSYTNNEVNLEICEEIHAIVDKMGAPVIAEVTGKIMVDSKLSGTPNLLLSFTNPRLVDDASFHRCVRLKRWASEKVLSFIPPDRNFELMTYTAATSSHSIQMPIYTRHEIKTKADDFAEIDINIGARGIYGKSVENVRIELPLPDDVSNVSCIATHGSGTYKQHGKLLTWNIGKIEAHIMRNIKITVKSASIGDLSLSFNVHFTVPGVAVSGIKMCRLELTGNVDYKPFKSTKYMTNAGKFQVRF